MTGTIYKGIGGFYYVKTEEALLECRARGLFRRQGLKPLPGDRVRIEAEAGSFRITDILPRKNVLARPPVANVSRLLAVVSAAQPPPNFLGTDTLLAMAADAGIEAAVILTKTDLAPPEPVLTAYARSGIAVFVAHARTGRGLAALRALLPGGLSVFCGHSGVGKSTLLNALAPEARRATGEISRKLGRGRHTTREVELFAAAGGLLADTPGFGSIDLPKAAPIPKESLQYAFPEIGALAGRCRFTGCAHLAESGCAVRAALAAEEISPTRYASYAALYAQAKEAESHQR